MVVAFLSFVGFNVVDTYFVGQLGTNELAAISFTFPVVMVVSSVSIGIGIGTTSAVSRAIGEGDSHKIRRLTTDAITLGLVVTALVALAGLFTIDPLFRALGAEEEIIVLIRQYMVIWYLGVPVVVIPQVGNSAIRATGDTRTPAAIMIGAMLANLVLDPLLIFGWGPVPALGLTGAAIATVAARAVALGLSLLILVRRERMITTEVPPTREGLASWVAVLYIAIPAGLTQLIVPLSTGVITRLVSGYGVEAVAGFGVATRLELFAILPVNALASALMPFLGQNWGAGKTDRVRTAVRTAMVYALVWGLALWLVALVLGPWLAGLFNDDPLVVETTVAYLWIVGTSFGFWGIFIVSASAFNSLNRPIPSAVLSIVRAFVVWVPLAWIGASFFGLAAIWWAAVAANVVAGLLGASWFESTLGRMIAARGVPSPSAGAVEPREAAEPVS
jgi:putative MATE family efflux protein